MADAFSLNVDGAVDLVESGINKIASGEEAKEGPIGKREDALSLELSDEELLKLRGDYEKKYAPYEGKMVPIWKNNLDSYIGKENRDGNYDMGAANFQFQAEETFLAAAMAQNPDATVFSTNDKAGNALANDVKAMLQYHALTGNLRMKLKTMVRKWSVYHLGVMKMGWNQKVDDVDFETRKTKDFILDPDGYVDEFGNFTSWLGERIYLTAEDLIKLYPDKENYISLSVDGKLGTTVNFTMWWTDDFTFSTYKDEVLEKHRNPYFNYPDEDEEFSAINHFAHPKKPYVFLSVFSLQEQPHDITGLIEQNIPNQKKITRRTEQIDLNISKSNNSDLFSMENFNQETAKQAAQALRNPKQGEVLVPIGKPIQEAIYRLPAPNFPSSGFDDLENSKENLLASWGVQGIISQPQKSDTTARGMILNQQRDTSRIGGGITDVVEQTVSVAIYNWLVQLYKVFYDETHSASVMGINNAMEYVELSKARMKLPLVVGVSPNSMKPKDEITKVNQAMEAYQAGLIGPKVALEAIDFPNPDDSAADGALWKLDPAHYFQINFPEEFQKVQQLAMQEAQAQAQAQMQAQQAQAQQGAQQQAMEAGMAQQSHMQKLQQSEDVHRQKLRHSEESASEKLAQMKSSVPK